MLKDDHSLKEYDVEQGAVAHLQAAFDDIPFLQAGEPTMQQAVNSGRPDLMMPIHVRGNSWMLVCEVKSSGQPRFVREAAFQLQRYLKAQSRPAYGIVIAPYLSPESTALLKEESLGYLDFAGNCFFSFDGVYIERTGSPHTPEKRRELRDIFSLKASRILRILFTDPRRSWRVTELAKRAHVSLGQVSNVRRALLDREWASVDDRGLKLQKPGAILDAWRSAYSPKNVEEVGYYTLLHGSELTAAIKRAFGSLPTGDHLLLSSLSAANWLFPFARSPGTYFYGDDIGMSAIRNALHLEPAQRGSNVSVVIPKDNQVFIDEVEPAPGIRCTGPLQTYLDLSQLGDRGREAADHLRQFKLEPQWSAT